MNSFFSMDNYKRHSLYLILGIAAYALCVSPSKDWVHYVWWFNFNENASWNVMLENFSFFREPLYNFSMKFVGQHMGFSMAVLVGTLSLLWLKLHSLARIVENPYIGTFFYVCLYLLLFEGTAIRVGYATAFVMLGVYYLKSNRYGLSLLMIIVASQIHFTAILFILLFPLYFIKFSLFFVFWIFLIAPLLIVVDISLYSIFQSFIEYINPRYLLYGSTKINGQNSTGLYFYFIGFYWLLLLFFGYFMRKYSPNDRFIRTLLGIAMAGVILMCVFHDHVALGARLGELLLLPVVILLSWLYQQWKEKKCHIANNVLIFVSTMYFFARLVYLFPRMITI